MNRIRAQCINIESVMKASTDSELTLQITDEEEICQLTKVHWQCEPEETAQPGRHLQSSAQTLLYSVLNRIKSNILNNKLY